MKKEEFLKFNKDVLAKLDELDKSKVYLMQVDVKDIPDENRKRTLIRIKELCDENGIATIIIAYNSDSDRLITVDELQKYLDESKENI